MSAPRHIAVPSTFAPGGLEGGSTSVVNPTSSVQTETGSRPSGLVEKAKKRLGRGETEKSERLILQGKDFNAIEHANDIVEVKEEEKRQVQELLHTWMGWVLDEHGIKEDAGSLDKTFVSLYTSMIDLKADETLTSEGIFKMANGEKIKVKQVTVEDVSFDNLKQVSQVQQLLQAMKTAEMYMATVIGMEVSPFPYEVDNTALGAMERIRQYGNAGVRFLSHKFSRAGNFPAEFLSKFDKRMKDARTRQQHEEEVNELFKKSPFGREAGAAGFKAFRYYVEGARAKDPKKGLENQRNIIRRIRSTRARMIDQLTKGEIHPDSVSADVQKLIDSTISKKEEYREWSGKSPNEIPIYIQQMMEADALLQIAQNNATERGEELHERHQMEQFTKDKLTTLHEKIEHFSGGPTAEQRVIDEYSHKFQTAQAAWKAKDTEIKNWRAVRAKITKNNKIWKSQVDSWEERYENIQDTEHPAYIEDNKARRDELANLKKDIDTKKDKIVDANNHWSELKQKIDSAQAELQKLKDVMDKAENEYNAVAGGTGADKEKAELFQAIEDIVKEDGLRNDLSHRIQNSPADLGRIYGRGESPTDSGANYGKLRLALGLEGSVFNKLVGASNENLRVCLAGIYHISFDEAEILGVLGGAGPDAVKVQQLDEQIWAHIRTAGKEGLLTTAEKVWLTMLDSVVYSGEPTLDMGDNYNYGEKDIKKVKIPESPPESAREKINLVLREKHNLIPGVNTVADYVRLSGGDIVAICVDENGKNIVVDQLGNNLGSMERLETINGTPQIIPSSSESITKVQSEIQRVLAIRRIRSEMSVAPGTPNEFWYISTTGPVDLLEEHGDLKVKNAFSPGQHQKLEEYLMQTAKGQMLARTTGTRHIYQLEQRGLDLSTRRSEVGDIQILEGEVLVGGGRGYLGWQDPTTFRPGINPNFETIRINFGEGDDVRYTRNVVRNIAGFDVSVAANPPKDINDPTLAGFDLLQMERVLEASYFYLMQRDQERRKQIAGYMPPVRVDTISANRSYQVGFNDKGDLIIRDMSDVMELTSQEHNAVDFLNEQICLGNVSDMDLRKIRIAVGKQFLMAENKRLQR